MAAKRHPVNAKTKNRPQTLKVIYHKVLSAVHMESPDNMNFVRGCVITSDLPLLATRLNINAEKIRINFPVSVFTNENHCIHYAAAGIYFISAFSCSPIFK